MAELSAPNKRIYRVTAEWKYKNSIRTRDFIICAENSNDAVIIAHNHLPANRTRSTKPTVYDDVDIKIYDLGLVSKNKTYYSGQILTKTGKRAKPSVTNTEKWLSRFSLLWGYELGRKLQATSEEEKQTAVLLAKIEDTENILLDWTEDYLETPVKNYKQFFDDKLSALIKQLQTK